MATQNTIGIGVVISDNGTAKKTIKNVEELHSTIKQTQTTAEKGVNLGGTAGSRKAVAAGYQPSAAAASAPTGSAEIMQYGQMRGSAGATGASARDFANQAQGLGGLVRLYATYAANIFAVGAAFRALSNAMDTSNMVKGLDQLGAASGTALGSLSKRFVEATDGAVSMREAMEAVTKASSAGMSDSNILRIATSAKQASQALGVDMSDAVSRLTRGITKMEPELLDELGIFIRVDDVVNAYAKSVDKSASSLTDFERRMAYANATLTQAEKKFGEIKLDTNPYTQLLAVIKDTSQSVLELVNKALVPMVNLLSSNPTALLAVLGGLGVGLVKQALPALSDYRKSLADMSDAAKEMAKSRLQDLKSSLGEELAAKVSALDAIAEAENDSFEQTSKKLAASSKKVKGYDTRAFEISQKAIPDISKEEIEYLEQLGTKGKKISATYGEMAVSLRNYTEAEELYNKAKQEQSVLLTKGSSLWTTIGQNELEYHNQVNEARKRGMVSSAAYTASTKGLVAGIRESFASFKSAGTDTTTTIDILNKAGEKTGSTFSVVTGRIGLFSRAMLLAKLSVVSAVAALGTAINAFMPWIQVLGLVVAAGGAFISWMSKNNEETAKFKSSLESSNASIKTLGETLDFINKKPFGQQFSTESLEARAKAFGEVGNSVKALVSDLQKVDKAASGFDRFIDVFKKIWGGDVRSQFAKSMTTTVIGALDAAGNTAEASKARKKIAELLNIDPKFTQAAFNKAIAQAADNAPLLEKVSQAMESVGIEAGITASKSRELDESLKASADAYKAVADQFKSKDPLALLGESLVASSQKLSQALSDPEIALKKFADIAADPDKLKLFDVEDQLFLTKYSKQLNQLNKDTDEQAQKVAKLAKEQAKLEELRASRGEREFTGELYSDEEMSYMDKSFAEILNTVTQLRKDTAFSDVRLAKARNEVFAVINKFPEIAANQLQKGADLINVGITSAMSKASSIFKETVLGSLGNMPGVAKAREQIELSKLAADRSLIEVQQQLIRATMENTVATQLANAKEELAARSLEDKKGIGTDTGTKMAEARARVTELEKKQEIVRMDPKQVQAAINKTVQEARDGNKEIAADAAGLLNYLNGLAGSSAQLAANAQQVRATQYKAMLEQLKEGFETDRRSLATSKEKNNLEQQRIANLETAQGYASTELTLAADTANKEAVALSTQEKLLAIQERRTVLEKAQKSKATSVSDKDFEAEQTRLNTEATTIALSNQSSISSINLGTSKKLLDIRVQELNRVSQIEKKQREIANTLEDTRNSTAAILLDTAKQTEAYTGEYLQALETEKSLRETQSSAQRAQAEETAAFNLARKTAQAEMWSLEDKGAYEAAERVQADMDRAKSIHETKLAQIEEEKQLSLRSIKEVADYREEREDFSQMIESVKGLDRVWAGVGTSIAAVMTAQDEMATSQKQLANQLENLTFERDAASDAKEKIKWQEKIDKTVVQGQKDEIKGYAKTVGAAKSMFKEKTAAHKALAAVEKVLHITRLAMDIKEMFSDTTKTGVSIANSMARTAQAVLEAGIDGVKAVVKAISGLPFPLNVAAGVATAAVIGKLLSQIGGKSPSVSGGGSFVPSAEQRQETQGTAMSYNSEGAKVQTSRGVFGDTDAKSESIANSLERIKETSVDGLRYDNKMVDLLSKINDGINNTAKSLYSIRGLRQGSMFETQEGETKGKGLLGSGLFASKTSTNITDSGVLINATFTELASDLSKSALQFYEDVSYTKKRTLRKTKRWNETITKTADSITQDYFNDIFSNATELFKEIGQDAGMQVDQVLNSLSGVTFADLSVSLRGLKGEDLEKELNAVISSMLDQGAEAVFSQFMQFEEFGEGMLETVIRVTDNNRKVKQALSNLGIGTLRNVIGMASYEITEALVEAAGGIQDFLAKAEDYRENFLTEAERLAPIQLEVATEIARIAKLGYTSADGLVDTRQEFKALVQSLDLTTETGRTAYTALMGVAEGFHQVTEATETALQATIDKFKKFADDLRAFRDNLVLGSSSILTPLQKYAESKLQFEETYAQALAGDEAAQGKLTNSAQTFLTASKDYFASSSQYTQDFNSVLDKVGAGITGAETQISIAERQLNGITEQIGLLTTINENIAYIAGVPQAASGGRVHGLTLVGERGPELVDFANPGMVYPADQTRGMFAPQNNMSNNIYQVVAELRQVKQELAQLRQEQRQQTGDLIVSNYDANNRAAETISAEVALTTTQKEWQERNAPAVV